ncbi:phage tail length tape measure family protein, partial [Bacteroidales bacterium OttesenSCG-928-C19]|nr:phage tail length tape measure family protein [Bacteroidales bacterium OttesenSCG-928-C19]
MSKDLLYKIVGIDDFTSVMQGAEKEGTTSFRTLDREQNKVISGSEKLTNSFGKLKGVIAGAGIVAGAWKIGRQAMETLQLYDTQIQAETQLKNALEQTGNTAKKTQDELTQRASKLQDNSLIGDEVWMQAMTKLTEYRNVSGKVFDEAVVMAGEMATRMGTDVVSSAKLLGSALNEPEKGLEKLREVGVTFSKKQAEAFKKLV